MLCIANSIGVVQIREEFVDIMCKDLAKRLGNNGGQLTVDRRDLGSWSRN